jgi:hypothetical protein
MTEPLPNSSLSPHRAVRSAARWFIVFACASIAAAIAIDLSPIPEAAMSNPRDSGVPGWVFWSAIFATVALTATPWFIAWWRLTTPSLTPESESRSARRRRFARVMTMVTPATGVCWLLPAAAVIYVPNLEPPEAIAIILACIMMTSIVLVPVHLIVVLWYLSVLGADIGSPRLRSAALRMAVYFIAAAIALLGLSSISYDLAEPEATYAFWAVFPVATAPVIQGAWLISTLVRTFPPTPPPRNGYQP